MDYDQTEPQTIFHDVLLGALFIGLGQMVLFLAVPKSYMLLSNGVAKSGVGVSVDDLPISALWSLMQPLLDTVGAVGASSLLAAAGIGIIVFGWRRFLRDKFD